MQPEPPASPDPPATSATPDDPFAGVPSAVVVRDALAAVGSLGGFFAVTTREAEGADPSWRPLTDLLGRPGPDGGGGDPLVRRIDEVAGQLGASRRVAASLLSISLAARFTSLVLAAAVEHRLLLRLAHDDLHWRPWSGGPMPLWAPRPAAAALGPPEEPATATAVAAELADRHVEPLVAAFRARVSISPRVLRGNAVSSLAGAVRVLATARPARRDPAVALGRGMVTAPPLAGLGGFVPEPAHPTGVGFARRTCCLYHRMPGGGICEDCVLRHADGAGARVDP